MNDPWFIDPLNISIRLGLALVLGGLIGLERESSNRAAGLRTNILVCVGSALVMILSMYGFSEFVEEANVRTDPARLAAQVISGIGFLGAGVILRNGTSITGLTTAATLWVVAAIGLAVGAGEFYMAIAATVLVLFSLLVLNVVEKKWLRAKSFRVIKIKTKDRPGSLGEISALMHKLNIEIRKISMEQVAETELSPMVYIYLSVKLSAKKPIAAIVEDISMQSGVSEVTVD